MFIFSVAQYSDNERWQRQREKELREAAKGSSCLETRFQSSSQPTDESLLIQFLYTLSQLKQVLCILFKLEVHMLSMIRWNDCKRKAIDTAFEKADHANCQRQRKAKELRDYRSFNWHYIVLSKRTNALQRLWWKPLKFKQRKLPRAGRIA